MILGIDTSNYKTSAALFDPSSNEWVSKGRFLDVEQGKLGLRQSEALFQHVLHLPDVIRLLENKGEITAIGYSDKPREVEGSYMPCFNAGASLAKSMAALLNIPAFAFSHQQGHLSSALFSVDKLEMLKEPFLAWHLSGGTTELLLVKPDDEVMFKAEIIGGTTDIAAGQVIDRCGVALGMPFPSGKYVEETALQSSKLDAFTARCDGGFFSLSGFENKFKDKITAGEAAHDVSAFVLRSISSTIHKVSLWARKEYPNIPMLISGGVSVCSILQRYFDNMDNVYFARFGLGGDNALGAAVLADLEMKR